MLALLLPLFIVTFSLFIGCGNPLIQKIVEPKKVNFESNGGSHVASQIVFKDQPVKRPPDPSKSRYDFSGWYRDNETFEEQWDFAAVPNAEMILYAKWTARETIPITDAAITITAPETDAVPVAAVSGVGYTGTVSWDPDHNPFQAGKVYTATFTLTAHEEYAFAPELTAAVNGNNAVIIDNTPFTLTLSYEFPATRMYEQIFEVEIADITDPDFGLNIESGIIISRAGTNPNSKNAEIRVNIPAGWTIEWLYNGEILGSGSTLTLRVSDNPLEPGYDSPYNIVGEKHLLTVVIVTAEGAPYSRKIEFEVKP